MKALGRNDPSRDHLLDIEELVKQVGRDLRRLTRFVIAGFVASAVMEVILRCLA